MTGQQLIDEAMEEINAYIETKNHGLTYADIVEFFHLDNILVNLTIEDYLNA